MSSFYKLIEDNSVERPSGRRTNQEDNTAYFHRASEALILGKEPNVDYRQRLYSTLLLSVNAAQQRTCYCRPFS